MFKLHPQLATDCFQLGGFPLSRLLLMNDSRYPWLILVPTKNEVQEQFQLLQTDQHQLMVESALLAKVLMQVFDGDKMNIAALGNIVPQLHIHHVVRFKSDEVWPAPVWGNGSAVSYEKNEAKKIISLITSELNAELNIIFEPANILIE